MLSSNNKHAVLLIPEKSNIHLSEEVMLYLLMQVPKGRLTRQEDMEAYLAARYGVHHIWIDRTPYMARIMLNPEYIHRILDHVPMHREVSANGYLSDPIRLRNYRTKDLRYFYLHGQVIPPRVKDYKKYLFDYHKELTISMENLNRIQIHGLSQFLSAVSK